MKGSTSKPQEAKLVCSINMSIIEDDELTLRAFRESNLKIKKPHREKDAS
jgi:hypothetical protein